MPDPLVLALILLALGLLGFAAVLAAEEAAVTSVPHQRVRESEEEGRRGVRSLKAVLEDLPTHINVLVFMRTLCETGATVSITMILVELVDMGWRGFFLALGISAVLVFTVAGVSPRSIGRGRPLEVALLLSWLAHGLRRGLGPLARILVWLGNMLAPGKVFKDGPFVTEEQLRDLVERASASDVIEDEEREMIQSVFQLGDTTARQVMVPRPDLVTVGVATSLHDSVSLFHRSGFSRVPVVGESEDDVLGVLYLKDVARRLHLHPEQGETVTTAELARSVSFVPETKPIDELLRHMQREATHVCIVVDEYGGTAGLITIEDIVEEIVGDIDDEHDAVDEDIVDLGDGSYRISTRMHLHELAELWDMRLEDEDVTTLGGLLAKALGRVPIAGSAAVTHGLRIEALPGTGRRHRITSLIVRREEYQQEEAPR